MHGRVEGVAVRLDHDWRRKGDARGQVIEAGIEGRPSTGGAPVIVCVLFRYDFFVARETPCVAGVPAHAPWIERERERDQYKFICGAHFMITRGELK